MKSSLKEITEAYRLYRKIILEYENYLMWRFPEYDCVIREHDKDIFEVVFMVRNNKNRCDHTFFVRLDQLENVIDISETIFLPSLI